MKYTSRVLIYVTFLSALSCTSYAQSGEDLFKQICVACHTVGGGRLVGPDLKGITNVKKEDWLIKWIKSSQTVVKSGDTAATAIFKAFNMVPMPDQPTLSDAQVKSILAYIASKSGGAVAANATAAAPSSDAVVPSSGSSATSTVQSASVQNVDATAQKSDFINPDSFFIWLCLGLVVTFLIVIVWTLTSTIRKLADALKENMKG